LELAFPNICHAQIARRANMSHTIALGTSGKSRRSSRASHSKEEGRLAIVTNVGVGCGGRGSVARENGIAGRVKACERSANAQDERR
jgi:hypothetical protein